LAAEDQKMPHEVTTAAGGDLPRRISVAERMRWSRVDITHADRLGEILTDIASFGKRNPTSTTEDS
jgi:hypothetical protein